MDQHLGNRCQIQNIYSYDCKSTIVCVYVCEQERERDANTLAIGVKYRIFTPTIVKVRVCVYESETERDANTLALQNIYSYDCKSTLMCVSKREREREMPTAPWQ